MIDDLLKPFQRFGVHLGLERIERLLADLGNPHERVPVIHVAGTNGKGSVCAYLSSVLTEAGYKVGRYTSPHLVDWTERICLNECPIAAATLENLLRQIQQAIAPDTESPTQFEVITAAAWLYFAQAEVDVAVVEVGLGGRLDATNVCQQPLVSIITSLSREHWQNLGPTVADIAKEKAGILKPGCPAVIGILPPDAKAVVVSRLEQLACPAVWVEPAKKVKSESSPVLVVSSKEELANPEGQKSKVKSQAALRQGGDREMALVPSPSPPVPQSPSPNSASAFYEGIEYPLPLLGEVQLLNSAIAIAALKVLQNKGWQISQAAIQTGMAKTCWLGRLQWTTWRDRPLLIDGAHNPAAAQALRQYVDTLDLPVAWVMGILSTKDHAEIFQALLKPGDRLYLVPVPDHSTAAPEALASLAKSICPDLDSCQTYSELFEALHSAIGENHSERVTAVCGSLYLVGYFLQHNR